MNNECSDEIYLDYAANTPVDKAVLDVFYDATLKYWYNSNSTHNKGKMVKEKIDLATKNIMDLLRKNLNIKDMELIYTSGATEANNLAIKGVADIYKMNGKHIISTFLEHSSVSSPLTYLKEQGYEIDILEVLPNGKVNIEHLKELLRKDTILVSICSIDSEIGTIQEIEKIASIVKEYPNTLLHVDYTQSMGKFNCNLENVDLITFAPHKFYGLNGIGALLKKEEVVLNPVIMGGKSMSIYRSGTMDVAQILAFYETLKIAFLNITKRYEYVMDLNTKIREELKKYNLVEINSIDIENPYILNFGIKGVKSVELKEMLNNYNVFVSVKSACSHENTPSRSVMAITHDRKRAMSSIRVSLSHHVTKNQIVNFFKVFDMCYTKLIGDKTNGKI